MWRVSSFAAYFVHGDFGAIETKGIPIGSGSWTLRQAIRAGQVPWTILVAWSVHVHRGPGAIQERGDVLVGPYRQAGPGCYLPRDEAGQVVDVLVGDQYGVRVVERVRRRDDARVDDRDEAALLETEA